MLKGLGDIGNIMKLQREFKNVQKKLKKTECEGDALNGAVKALVNGDYKLVDLRIDESLIGEGDAKKIEKAVISAVNSAVDRSKEIAAQEMSKLTGGMNIPGLNNFFK